MNAELCWMAADLWPSQLTCSSSWLDLVTVLRVCSLCSRGIRGNKCADVAAKSALSSTVSAVKCSPTDLYQSLTNYYQRLWQVECTYAPWMPSYIQRCSWPEGGEGGPGVQTPWAAQWDGIHAKCKNSVRIFSHGVAVGARQPLMTVARTLPEPSNPPTPLLKAVHDSGYCDKHMLGFNLHTSGNHS